MTVVCVMPMFMAQQTPETLQLDNNGSIVAEGCSDRLLPERISEWKNVASASYIEVEWGYGNVSNRLLQ